MNRRNWFKAALVATVGVFVRKKNDIDFWENTRVEIKYVGLVEAIREAEKRLGNGHLEVSDRTS